MIISPSIAALFDYIGSFGYEARFVGGFVRNLILETEPATDIDIATNMPINELFERLQSCGIKCIPTGLKYGSIMVIVDGESIEITTLRKDIETDGRHAVIEYTSSWQEDSLRRDFTFNAIYCDRNGQFYDYHNGISDLKNRIVRFIGDPEQRIKEDYLRILRYFRFVVKYDYNCYQDLDTLKTIKKLSVGLKNISGERIYRELMKTDLTKGMKLIANEVFDSHCPEFNEKIKELSNEQILAVFCAYSQHEDVVTMLCPTRKFRKLYVALRRLLENDAALSRMRPEMQVIVKKCIAAVESADLIR